jgi:hypothetical protein
VRGWLRTLAVGFLADYSSAHADFDPTAVAQAPNDPTLQNTLAASWHA